MSSLMTGTGDIATNLQGYYDRNLLVRAIPELYHAQFGQTRPMPKNKGTRINFRRYESLAVNTTPLTEGVTPTGKKLATTDIYATLKQYGDFVTLSDWLMAVGLDPALVEAGELLGEQMGETLDTIYRNVLVAGTTIRYASGVAARVSVTNAPADSDINSMIRTLEGNNAKKIKQMVKGGAKVSTTPLRPAFVGICHPDSRYDIEALTGFQSVEEYSSHGDKMEGEFGAVKNVRFISTTNGYMVGAGGVAVGATGLKANDSTNIDVYATLILAQNAYGIIPLTKMSIKNIIKKMGSGGSEDPLDQRATSGWKASTTCKILNDDFMVRWEHGVTDL